MIVIDGFSPIPMIQSGIVQPNTSVNLNYATNSGVLRPKIVGGTSALNRVWWNFAL